MIELRPTDALLVIDMQHDFLPGGALAVQEGDQLLAGIEALAPRFDHVILTQDWHPEGHISFAGTHLGKRPFLDTIDAAYGKQSLWPEHTRQGTRGAELAVNLPQAELILRKGFRRDIDSYSAFVENDKCTGTGLAGYLRERRLHRLFFCGLALDFCLGASAADAARLGFEAWIVGDLTRAVGLPAAGEQPGSVPAMEAALAAEGVHQVTAAELVPYPREHA